MLLQKKIEFTGHSAAIYCIDGSGDFFFTGSGDKFVAKWNSTLGTQEKFSIKLGESIFKLKLINNSQFIVIGTSAGSLHIVDLENKLELKHFIQHKSAIFEICENTQNQQFYTSDLDGNLAVWDSKSFELIIFLPLNCGKIRKILIENDSFFLACQNGEIKQFDSSTFNEISSFHAHENGTNALALAKSNPKILISAGKDGYLRFWDRAANYLKKLEIPAHNFGIYQIDFFNDDKNFISISRDKSIKLWDCDNWKVLQKIERKHGGHSHAVNAFWKKSESEFITVSDDKRINNWELIVSKI
jgi:WD40 repeat protein